MAETVVIQSSVHDLLNTRHSQFIANTQYTNTANTDTVVKQTMFHNIVHAFNVSYFKT